jgi:GNAT superfamily N-acetyltransferase
VVEHYAVVIMDRVKMYELDNDQPDGVDLPDEGHDSYRNQWLLEDFLHKNGYPITLDWGNPNMKFIVLIENGDDIVGLSAIISYKRQVRKVHLCAMLVVERLRRRGLGTEMLKRIAVLYPQNEVTLSVLFEQCDVLSFYMNRGYAQLKSVDIGKRCFVMSLVNLKLLQDVSLPD